MGDGSEAFDFVAVEDCALANVCAMKSEAVNQNYNVGTGIRTSLRELAEKLLSLTGCQKPIQYVERSQATLVRNRIGDPSRAMSEIDFQAQIGLDEGLKRLISWRKSHKDAVDRRKRAVGIEV
jgi:UDP-glucose 4-epimerase